MASRKQTGDLIFQDRRFHPLTLSFAKIQIRLNKQCGEACNIVTRAKIQGRGVLAKDSADKPGRAEVLEANKAALGN
jgi:hypothetical protein